MMSDLITPNGALNAQAFAEAMARAVTMEVRPVAAEELLDACLAPAYHACEPRHRHGAEWPEYAPAGLVSLLHGEWMRRIGEWLGFEDPEPELGDGWFWITEEMPGIRSVARHLIRIHLDVLRTVAGAFEAENGHSMVDVFVASAASGEEFDQSNARLHHHRTGLRRVK